MIALCLNFLISASDSSAGLELNLKAVIEASLQSEPSLKQAKEKLQELDAKGRLAVSSLLPTIEGDLSYKRKKDSQNAARPQFGGESYNYFQTNLSASQPLLVRGFFSAIHAVSSEKRIGQLDFEISRRDLILKNIQIFYKILVARRQSESISKAIKIHEQTLSETEHRVKIGRGQRLDLLQVKTEIAKLGSQMQRTLGELKSSTAELAQAMGRPYESDIAIHSIWKKIDVKEVLKKWMGLNPELLEVQRVVARRQQIDESITTLLGKHWPRIDAVGDLTWLGYSKSALFDGDAMSWGAGVTLSVPIFSGLSYLHERQEYQAQLMQAKFEEDKVVQSTRLSQIQASENLKTAEAVIDSLHVTVDLASQALEEARRNYRVSTIDYLQLLQTENSVLDASLLLDQGQYDLIVALISYVKAFGFSADHLVEVLS